MWKKRPVRLRASIWRWDCNSAADAHPTQFRKRSYRLSDKVCCPCRFRSIKMTDLVEIWWATSIFWSVSPVVPGQSFPDLWVIPISLDSSQVASPWINVRIPVKVPPGRDGSCSNSDLSCAAFLLYLWENQDRSPFLFSRAFRALMPSKDRNAVMDTIINATAASASRQNNPHTVSMTDFLMRKPEMRTMAIMIIKTLKHRNMPRKIFCFRFILTFQSKMRGIEMTMSKGQNSGELFI